MLWLEIWLGGIVILQFEVKAEDVKITALLRNSHLKVAFNHLKVAFNIV